MGQFVILRTEASERAYWKQLEPDQVKLVNSIVKRSKTRSSTKEMITSEIDYASKNKEDIGLYKKEWELVVNILKDKVEMKGTRNKDEIHYLIRILSSFIKKEMD